MAAIFSGCTGFNTPDNMLLSKCPFDAVLQCVAVCCRVLQSVAVCCSVLQCVGMLQCVAV